MEPMRLTARARDIVTPAAGGMTRHCAEDSLQALLRADRVILSIEAQPVRGALARLVGERGGGHLRGVLDQVVPEERDNETPLYLLLDDISGTSLIAPWAWSQWNPDWHAEVRRMKADPEFAKKFRMDDVCIGLRRGSSGHDSSAEGAPTADLRHPEDPEGWHEFPVQQGVAMRRARRIDVTVNGFIQIDAAFQDSATTPAGERAALHEYRLTATADPRSLELLALSAEPRVLPFPECPAAAANVSRLLGTPLPQLREAVLARLPGTQGCTHLNDALRALAEVPALVRYLRPG